ncbi:MAG: hypothetical protein RR651_06085, partial [Lysinibacillus sp.]
MPGKWQRSLIMASLIVMVAVIAFLFIDRTSNKVSVGNRQVEQAYIDDLSERTIQLAKLLVKNENFSLNLIKVDLGNFPKRLIYVDLKSNRLIDVNNIEKSIRDVLESEEAKLLIRKNETFEIIILDTNGE